MFHQHINQSIGASIGPPILAQITAAIGEPHWGMRLMAGLGGVDSATPSYAMWDLSRQVVASKSLTALLDAGSAGLYRRAAEAAAEGQFTHVYVGRESRRPVALPEAWRAKLEGIRLNG